MRKSLKLCRALSVALFIALFAPPSSYAETAATSETVLPEVLLTEIPASVAVSNNGVTALAYFDQKVVAIAQPALPIKTVAAGCPPIKVEISDTGDYIWFICNGDRNLYVLDSKSLTVSSGNLNIDGADNIQYLPQSKRLVAIGSTGQVSIISVRDLNDYEVLATKFTLHNVTSSVVDQEGKRAYLADMGLLHVLNLSTFEVITIPLQNSKVWLAALALSKSGKTIYGAGADISYGENKEIPFVTALNTETLKVTEQKLLTLSGLGLGNFFLTPSDRRLYVGSGTGVNLLGNTSSGLFAIDIAEDGTLGNPKNFYPSRAFVNALSSSQDRKRIAIGLTSTYLAQVLITDTPYPVKEIPAQVVQPTSTPDEVEAALKFSAKLTDKALSLTGFATGFGPGTKITVYLRDANAKIVKFKAQKKKVAISANGKFVWKGSAPSKKIEVYVKAGALKSSVLAKKSK